MRNNSLQVPLNFIALKTHTKTLATLLIENQDILKSAIIFDNCKIEVLTIAFRSFIKSISDIWKENEILIKIMQSNINAFPKGNDELNSHPLYPQRDYRYQRTVLQIKLKNNIGSI
jgi:hypothetical protein